MTHLTTTTIDTPEQAEEYLRVVGTEKPSLHPKVDIPDRGYAHPSPWNGWNHTRAVGMDAEGRPVVIEMTHYASSRSPDRFAVQRAGVGSLNWSGITYPLEMLPAVAIINHPEHTPTD